MCIRDRTGTVATSTPADGAIDSPRRKASTSWAPSPPNPERSRPGDLATSLADVERTAIERALEEARFNKSRAARALGITRGELYGKLRRLGIDTTT